MIICLIYIAPNERLRTKMDFRPWQILDFLQMYSQCLEIYPEVTNISLEVIADGGTSGSLSLRLTRLN